MISEKILKVVMDSAKTTGDILEYSKSATLMNGILAYHAANMRKAYHIVAPLGYDRTALNRLVMTSCGGAPTDHYTVFNSVPENRYSLVVVNWCEDVASTLDEAASVLSPGGCILFNMADECEDVIFRLCEKYNMVSSKRMLIDGHKEAFTIIKKAKESIGATASCSEKITIALVLKTGGGVYDHRYVNALAKNIKQHVTIPHEIVCLTDDSRGIDTEIVRAIPLQHGLPKWWSKIELFNSINFHTSRVFYMDLDTVVVDNIDEILIGTQQHAFVALRDFYHMFTLQTGIMAWHNGSFDHVYQKFVPRMHYFASPEIGDHVWIGENASKTPEFFQDLYGNKVVSYKKDCKNGRLPSGTKIVCFHGNPRPHTVTDKFVLDNWMYQK